MRAGSAAPRTVNPRPLARRAAPTARSSAPAARLVLPAAPEWRHAAPPGLRWTRLSLFYVAGYLFPTGAGLLGAPDQALQLFRSTGDYGSVFPRALGLLLLGLGLITVQLIRHRSEPLYPTTVAVRGLFLAGFAWLYWMSLDPFFLIIIAIVAFGVLLTSTCLAVDLWRGRGR